MAIVAPMSLESKLLILLLVLFFVSLSSEAREQRVAISGSSTVMPLAELSAEEFNLLQDNYHVSVTSGGTGVGIVDAAEGRSDIAMASREFSWLNGRDMRLQMKNLGSSR